mgnify:CR=1 FL=1
MSRKDRELKKLETKEIIHAPSKHSGNYKYYSLHI